MKMLGIVFLMFLACVLWYAMWGRAWLKAQTWAQGWFAFIEPMETALYKKSETMLVGRLAWVSSLVVTAYDGVATFATGLDLTPITSRILSWAPEDMRGLIVAASVGAIGLMITRLRMRTTKPIELIAAPTTPATVAAEATVDVANANAVAVAKAA